MAHPRFIKLTVKTDCLNMLVNDVSPEFQLQIRANLSLLSLRKLKRGKNVMCALKRCRVHDQQVQVYDKGDISSDRSVITWHETNAADKLSCLRFMVFDKAQRKKQRAMASILSALWEVSANRGAKRKICTIIWSHVVTFEFVPESQQQIWPEWLLCFSNTRYTGADGFFLFCFCFLIHTFWYKNADIIRPQSKQTFYGSDSTVLGINN